MRWFFRTRRHVTSVVVGLAMLCSTMLLVISVTGESDSRSAGADSPPVVTTTTDPTAQPVNPWAVNDPETIIHFIESYCPPAPPLTPTELEPIRWALFACLGEIDNR